MIKRILLCFMALMAGGRATAEWIEVPLPELAGACFYNTNRITQLVLPYQVESLDSAWIHVRGFAAPGLAAGDGVEIPWDETIVLHPQTSAFFPPDAPCCIIAYSEELDGGFDVDVPFHRYFQAPFDFLLEGPGTLRLGMAEILGWYVVVESPFLWLEEVSFIAEVFPDLPPIDVEIQASGAGILLSWDDTIHREWAIHRLVHPLPHATRFKPCGVPLDRRTEVVLAVDEFEALDLADGRGLHHAQAGAMMGVSRATFGRILEAARKKVITALRSGFSLRIEGGSYEVIMTRNFVCADCGHRWESQQGRCHTPGCPQCGSARFGCEHKPNPDAGEAGCCGTSHPAGGEHAHGHGDCGHQ